MAESAFSTTEDSLPEISVSSLMKRSISPVLPFTLPVIEDASAITFLKSASVRLMLLRFSSDSTSLRESMVSPSFDKASSNLAISGPMLAETVSTKSASDADSSSLPSSANSSEVPQSIRIPFPPIMLVL